MKILTMDKAVLRRRILRFNVLLGLLAFVAAIALSLTGEYASLLERQQAEAVFNMMALAGVCYAAFSWIFCVMSKPFWFPTTHGGKS